MSKPRRALPASIEAARFLARARQYRAQTIKLEDQEGFEPNWPKHFLMTHAIELAINAYLVFERGLGRPRTAGGGPKPDGHDLMGRYSEAVRRGLKSNRLGSGLTT